MDLQYHRFLSYFEAFQRLQLIELATLEEFPEEKVIFEEGEIPDFLYLVLFGQVIFSKRTPLKGYQEVAIAEVNDFFGEFGVLDGQPRSTRATAGAGAILARIPRDRLMDILDQVNGKVVLDLFRHIVQHLRFTTDRYVNLVVHKEKMALVGEMVNTIVHDFRSPFTGIQLSSAMVKELYPEDEDLQEWCDLIQAQIARMLIMADEVLAFSSGNARLEKKPVGILDLLHHYEKLNTIYLRSTQVELAIAGDNPVINVDENKLTRVFQNLIGNAVDAIGNRKGKIEININTLASQVEIQIKDNGSGIPLELQSNLFDPFVTFGKRGGTGLGTAIAKSIIDAHGGDISFISVLNQGTTFKILLPLDLIPPAPLKTSPL